MREEQTAKGAKGAEDGAQDATRCGANGAAAPRNGDGPSGRRRLPQGENPVSRDVIEAALRVHSEIGPGALEEVYKVCLAYELRDRGREVATEVPIEVIYRSVKMNRGYRADMIVDGIVIVECKAAAAITPRFETTMISHLKLARLRLGLIINFHELHLRDGIKRLVNRL